MLRSVKYVMYHEHMDMTYSLSRCGKESSVQNIVEKMLNFCSMELATLVDTTRVMLFTIFAMVVRP